MALKIIKRLLFEEDGDISPLTINLALPMIVLLLLMIYVPAQNRLGMKIAHNVHVFLPYYFGGTVGVVLLLGIAAILVDTKRENKRKEQSIK